MNNVLKLQEMASTTEADVQSWSTLWRMSHACSSRHQAFSLNR
ncbi:class III lanthipeptide [Pseudoalteromonas luteoviolacea]|nr:class III lanthipeptide [Pseudoalteromonas luteoviolacea]